MPMFPAKECLDHLCATSTSSDGVDLTALKAPYLGPFKQGHGNIVYLALNWTCAEDFGSNPTKKLSVHHVDHAVVACVRSHVHDIGWGPRFESANGGVLRISLYLSDGLFIVRLADEGWLRLILAVDMPNMPPVCTLSIRHAHALILPLPALHTEIGHGL